jgi:glycosyltransferase involved in cell wall biosynthesis
VGVATVNSSVDLAFLRERHPGAPLVRVIDGCDVDYFDPKPFAGIRETSEIAFVGNMLYPPNADAARQLATEILPRIRRARPDARALLIGPDARGAIADLRGLEAVEFTGFVEDVRPFLARAAVVVSPLRFGAGMKNKLQAGLAMEKAMVVSSVTCEGFDDLVHGRHALVADEPNAFASAVIGLLEDPGRRRALGSAGAALIRGSYTWPTADAALWKAVSSCPPAAA